MKINLFILTSLISFGLITIGCQDTSFSGNSSDPKQEGILDTINPTSSDQHDLSQLQENQITSNAGEVIGSDETLDFESQGEPIEISDAEQEVVTANEPIPVGGSFLGCFYHSDASSLDEYAIQCNIRAYPAGIMAEDIKFSYVVTSSTASPMEIIPLRTDFLDRVEDRIWEWKIFFPRESMNDYETLRVQISIAAEINKFVEEISLINTRPRTLTVAPIHLGNNAFERTLYSNSCLYELGATQSRGISANWNFEVLTEEGGLTLTIRGVCGIGVDGNLRSKIVILNQFDQVMAERSFDRLIADYNIEDIVLPKGIYTMRVTTHRYNSGDYDDFLIQSMKLQPFTGVFDFK